MQSRHRSPLICVACSVHGPGPGPRSCRLLVSSQSRQIRSTPDELNTLSERERERENSLFCRLLFLPLILSELLCDSMGIGKVKEIEENLNLCCRSKPSLSSKCYVAILSCAL